MSNLLHSIRRSLSLRLSLGIFAFVVAIFMVTIGFLFYRSRQSVLQGTVSVTTQMLTNMSLQLNGIMDEVEMAVNNTEWQVMQHLTPDSLFALSRHILEVNPNLNGCSISFEPYYFQEWGKYFSAYSMNNDGHIETEQEGNENYNYFEMSWYAEPKKQGKACWVDPFKDYNPSGIYDRDMIASYCRPLITSEGKLIGIISADLSQRRLSQLLSQDMSYPNSYYMLLGKHGKIIAAGSNEARLSDLDSSDNLVLRQQVGNSGWTVAIICDKSDFFKSYNQLLYLVLSIILFGLLLMFAFCYYLVRKTIAPVSLLARQARDVTEMNFEHKIATSPRIDEVGQLQNSFASMQQSIGSYVAHLEDVKNQAEQRKEELMAAKNMAVASDRRKKAFIRDMFHQIRTPLNIISGFAQVLRDAYGMIDEEEKNTITREMLQNSQTITNIMDNWMRTLALEDIQLLERKDAVFCSYICMQAAQKVTLKAPDKVKLEVVADIPDNLVVMTDKECLLKVLTELLFNANKFTSEGTITLRCEQTDRRTVRFIVKDTGPGIPEADRERIFTQFTKLNDFNEGLGMGLSLCQRLATLLGGSLVLDKEYRDGACFILELPIP